MTLKDFTDGCSGARVAHIGVDKYEALVRAVNATLGTPTDEELLAGIRAERKSVGGTLFQVPVVIDHDSPARCDFLR